MYLFERFSRHLKNNVKNKAQVEGSICNAFLVEEASNFCSHYFEKHIHTRHRKVPRNDPRGNEEKYEVNISIFSHPGRAHGKVTTRYLDDREYVAANNYFLFNCHEVAPYTHEDIPTRLNDEEGGEMDLNDDEETPEEEILDESGKDFYLSDQSDDNDSGDDDFLN
ncbi:hypothetical protein DCAR_0414526 [Daucus carota subsp. sativus]|uniref:DUF4218 domain-containing protein n=1 Tax=Daucus carota subsp. sativus TaxID=79200 RepID=A0AAF1AWV0_DAUCS|nr:hypothetical protein DCAR_0414526 [Daucus carota subsp. sativus]